MDERFLRNEMLWGKDGQARLTAAHVIVFGLGGVGSYVTECLARAGVGELTLVDQDTLSLTNINRQLYALHSTVGQYKAEAAARRCLDINPDLRVHPICATYDAAHRDEFFTAHYDYIVDAIDLVSCKLDLIEQARLRRIPILTALGTGNKLDPTLLQVADISKTSGCPLARVIRKELRAREAHLLERRDILEMQQQEIDKVAPEAGEEERLEEQRAIVRAAEQTREQYELALGLLHGEEEPGLLDMLRRLERCLHQMARTDDSVSEDADAVTALRQQLSHLSGRLRRPPLPEDMPDVEQMEERLYALAQLKRKLHRSLDEILELREEIRENISFLDACALDITLLDKEEKQLAAQLQEVLSALLPQRREAAADFARQLEEELRQLGFSEQIRVIPDFMPQEVWPGLMDEKVRILWAPNPGQAPQPLDRIASGGELSRFLLALMSVRPKAESATYIFDEVDAGVGGLTLNKLAEKLENLAKQRQMLVITHWPQLAARAQKHFQISKTIRDNATFTTCVPLDARQRHAELVRMAGGGQQGEALTASLEGRSYQLTMF